MSRRRIGPETLNPPLLPALMRTLVFAVVTAVLVIAVASRVAAEDLLTVSPSARAALGVEVEPVETSSDFAGAEVSAVVIAPPGRLQMAITPFDGVVVEPLVVPGLAVEADDPVAVIYSQTYVEAEAELGSRRLMAEHRDELAEQAEQLLDAGLMSRAEAEEARHEAEAARLAYDAMITRLAITEPRQGAPGRFVLKAPSSGVIAHVHAESGDTVDAEGPVVSVFEGEVYWARALAPERSADLLATGAAVAIDGWMEPGEIVAIDPEVDAVSRSLEVLVTLPEGGPWRLGQILDLAFAAEAPSGAVSVPSAAVVRVGGRDVVFIERADGFEPVAVEVLARSRERVLIGGGPAGGDRVAVAGLAALKNMVEGG